MDFFSQFFLCVFLTYYDPSLLGPKVLVVGDSNVGTTLIGELVRLGSLRDHPWRIVPVSASGSALRHQAYWLPHLQALIAMESPDAVVVNLGTNDCGPDFPAVWTDLPAQARAIAEAAGGIPVVFVGVPPDLSPGGQSLAGPVGWINQWVLPYVVQARPGTSLVQVGAGRLGEDRVHYSEAGGRVTGGEVYAALQVALGEVVP